MKTNIYILLMILGLAACKNPEAPPKVDKEEMQEVYDGYLSDLNEFDSLSNLIANSKSIDSINRYTQLIENKFSSIDHVNIRDKYSRVFEFAFTRITTTKENTMDAYKDCLNNPNTADYIRKRCLYRLTSQLLRENKIDEIMPYYSALSPSVKASLSEGQQKGYSEISKFLASQLEKNSNDIPQDSFEYNQLFKVEPLCYTVWLEQELCINFDLLTLRLNNFIDRHPNSKLADDAQMFINKAKICESGNVTSNQAKINIINGYNLIKKYPDTNQLEDVRFTIIKNQSRVPNSEVEVQRIISLFEKEFPKSKYLDEIKRIKAQYNSDD